MGIDNRRQWANTQAKLKELEQLYATMRDEPGDDRVRELTLRSLKHRINQIKEELARFEARANTPDQHV
jgi:hypothetical protein